MSKLREAAVMALEALEVATTPRAEDRQAVLKAQAAIRAALASQTVPSDCSDSHQPDAWMTEARNEHGLPFFFCASEVTQAWPGLIPLYTAPPQRKPLTDEEIEDLSLFFIDSFSISELKAFARAIERAHGIGGEV